MTTTNKNSAPSPNIEYLPAIFRRVQQGDIRMPAFQRGYVWKDGQVVELLESIFRGFPIGSLLFWKVERQEMKVQSGAASFLPDVAEHYPTHYILDGLQRLSTLYAVFHYDPKSHPSKFRVYFDLETKEFDSTDSVPRTAIPLNILFRPKEFIGYHSKLATLPNGPSLIDAAVELHATFQEYLVPVVTIVGRTPKDVVQIFERINSTGTRLSAVDFMRAVTWSEKFDLNQQLEKLNETMALSGFAVPPETMVKVLAIALEHAPTSEAMLELRNVSPAKLQKGIDRTRELILSTIKFLRSRLGVGSFSLVPYEAQFLALVGFCSSSNAASDQQVEQVSKWYWTSSLNEDMQGRSEHQVAKLVAALRAFREGKTKTIKGRLTVSTSVLKERRFRWGTALSSSLAVILARNRSRSLITGDLIPSDELVAEHSSFHFVAFLSEDQLTGQSGVAPRAKILANIVAADAGDIALLAAKGASQVIRELKKTHAKEWRDILASQFISENAAESLLKGRPKDFLEHRAASILEAGKSLCFPS